MSGSTVQIETHLTRKWRRCHNPSYPSRNHDQHLLLQQVDPLEVREIIKFSFSCLTQKKDVVLIPAIP